MTVKSKYSQIATPSTGMMMSPSLGTGYTSGYIFEQTAKSVPEGRDACIWNVHSTIFSDSAGYPHYDVQIQSPPFGIINPKNDLFRIRFFSKRKPSTELEIIKALQSKINELEGKVFQLEHHQKNPLSVHCIEIRDLPYVEIKQQVLEYYKSHDEMYPDEIAVALGLDLESIMKAVYELKDEGKLEVVR